MHDIIAISNSIGHHDLFLTMTCNSKWPEILDSFLPGQNYTDRPDLCNRVFRMKHKVLMTHLKEDQPFGRVAADVSVIEFQKRGLVHAHIILFLEDESKFALENPENVDKVISAGIPFEADDVLRVSVVEHLIHRPCTDNTNERCIRNGRCVKRLRKEYRKETSSNEGDYYISYKRGSPAQGGKRAVIYVVRGMGKRYVQVDNS